MPVKPTLDQFNEMLVQEMLDEDIANAKEFMKNKLRRIDSLNKELDMLRTAMLQAEQNIANGNFYLVV